MMQTLLQDVRYGLRMLRKAPGLTAVILIMLTLGIGATTAMFTIFDAILLRPLAYEKPDELVQLWEKRTDGPFHQTEFFLSRLSGYEAAAQGLLSNGRLRGKQCDPVGEEWR